MTDFYLTLGLLLLGDIAIWIGFYYLGAQSHIRKCRSNGSAPNLRRLAIDFFIGFLLVHAGILWMGNQLVEWGGPA